MAKKICEENGVTLFETLTGFKFIGEKIKEFERTGDYTFLFGFEESNGYLAGTYARDKDAMVASMLIAEMACRYKTMGMNLYEALQQLYRRYGFYREAVVSVQFSGIGAQEKMAQIMKDLRHHPPASIGLPVLRIRDYQAGEIRRLGADTSACTARNACTGAAYDEAEVPEPTGLPKSNVLYYELEDECSAVIRPSGTEPKVKLYVMTKGADASIAESRLTAIQEAGSRLLK